MAGVIEKHGHILIFIIVFFSLVLCEYDDDFIPNSRRRMINDPGPPAPPPAKLRGFEWIDKRECHVEDEDGLCRTLENGTTCFGAIIPYAKSSTKHLDSLNWRVTNEYLEQYAVYSGLPECWRQLRELLCSTFYPPCKNGYILRVPRSLCIDAFKKCKDLIDYHLWPTIFGDCKYSNETSQTALDSVFTNDCKVPRNMAWPSNLTCMYPLISSDYATGWVVDHCALNCTGIRIDLSQPIQSLLMIGLCCIFIFTLLTAVLLFLEERDTKTRVAYHWPLFWFSIFHMVFSACWLVQMISGAHTTCRQDGSLRLREPNSVGLMCCVQYIILLGSSVGSSFWIVAFAYTHYLSKRRPNRYSFSPYQHFAVWSSALLMVTGGLASWQVDGDPIMSVCFVSKSSLIGSLWYMGPLALSSFAALSCYILSVACVIRHNSNDPSKDVTATQDARKTPSVSQVGGLLSVLSMLYLVSAALVFTDVISYQSQRQELRDFIFCKLGQQNEESGSQECHYPSETTIRLAQLQVFLMSMPALVVGVWLFICGDLRRRLQDYCPRWKSRRATNAANGNSPMTELAPVASRNAVWDGRRDSWRDWPSSSSITDTGAVSDPECRTGKKRAFFNRLKHRHSHYYGTAVSRSSNSLALCSVKTHSSLKSGPLPSDVMPAGSSLAELPFPDLTKYPMMSSGPTPGWWSPYNWPYPPWPWYCYYPRSSTSPNTSAAGLLQPCTSETTTVPNPAPDSASPATAPVSEQSNPAQAQCQSTSGVCGPPMWNGANSTMPYCWPVSMPTMPPFGPYWMPQAGPQNNNTNTSGPVETAKADVENAGANENENEKMEKNGEGSMKKEENADEEGKSETHSDEEGDSEEIDPEEETFVEEQLRSLLLGNTESR